MRSISKLVFFAALAVSTLLPGAGRVWAWESGHDGYYGGGYHDGYYGHGGHHDSYYGGDGNYGDGYYGPRYGYYGPNYYRHAGHHDSGPYYSGHGSYYGGYGSYYGNTYGEQCVTYVKIYDDAGGWVWGRRIAC